LEHEVFAFADDIAIVAKSESELDAVICKLEKLQEFISINKAKSGILPMRKTRREGQIRGFPVVKSYKYLGIPFTPSVLQLRRL